jgi:hypothetical protein
MQSQLEQIKQKLERLSPVRLSEVEDFVDFLRERDQSDNIRQDYAQASEEAFNKVWDNEEDAVYDNF